MDSQSTKQYSDSPLFLYDPLEIKLDSFEGPLGLLLHLIKKEEMNIYDIPIQKITSQYMQELKLITQLDLDKAGDFIAMAAMLIQIKSKMLLPPDPDTEEEYEDPRAELVQKLLDYKKYQEAVKKLKQLDIVGRDVFVKGMKEQIEKTEEIEIDETHLFDLTKSYKKLIHMIKNKVHVVETVGQSVYSRIMELRKKLVLGINLTLKDLYKSDGRSKLVVTFLSVLELSKLGFVSLFQSDLDSDIHIGVKKELGENIISRLDTYKGVQANEQ